MAVGDLTQVAVAAALLDRPEQLGGAAVQGRPAQTPWQLIGAIWINPSPWWTPALIRTKRLKAQLPQQGNGIGIGGRAADHPAADLGRPGLQSLLKQGLLNGAMAVIVQRAQQLRQMKDPAAAAAVERPGHHTGHRAIPREGHQATGRTAGEQIGKALLNSREPFTDQKALKP